MHTHEVDIRRYTSSLRPVVSFVFLAACPPSVANEEASGNEAAMEMAGSSGRSLIPVGAEAAEKHSALSCGQSLLGDDSTCTPS